jgi:hypothetical protein
MSDMLNFGIELEQQEGCEFKVRFDWPDVPGVGERGGCKRNDRPDLAHADI